MCAGGAEGEIAAEGRARRETLGRVDAFGRFSPRGRGEEAARRAAAEASTAASTSRRRRRGSGAALGRGALAGCFSSVAVGFCGESEVAAHEGSREGRKELRGASEAVEWWTRSGEVR